MSNRNDELLDTPSIVPDTEGRNTHRSNKKAPRSGNSTAPSSGLLRQAVSALMFVALSVFCALFYYENAQQKVLNDQLQIRLSTLESQLGVSMAANGQPVESLSTKVQDIDKDLKNTNDEIRKLWAITNDKHKKVLESHELKLAEQGKAVDSLQNTVTEMKKSVAQTEKGVAEASRLATESKQSAADASQAISEMRNAVGTLQQRVTQGDPQVREATQQAAMAQEQSEQLQIKLDGLSKRVSDHDESIRSIDSFRRSVSGDLGKLKQQSIEPSATAPIR
jgi:chromosome segregation ATPase